MSNRLRGRFPNRSSNRVPSWVLTAGGVPASLDIDFVNDRAYSASPSSIPILLSCTRASSGYYLNADGTLTQFSDGQLRYGTNGLLVEEQRINIQRYSQQFDQGSDWALSNSALTANTTSAPDGTLTAYKLKENSTGSTFFRCSTAFGYASAGSGIAYTASFYAKSAERTQVKVGLNDGANGAVAFFNLATGAVISSSGSGASPFTSVSATIQALASGWYRCILTATTSTASNLLINVDLCSGGTNVYTGVVGNGAYIWGAQIEAGAFATSYIPTTSGSLARNSDDVYLSATALAKLTVPNGTYYIDALGTPSVSNSPYLMGSTPSNAVIIGQSGSRYQIGSSGVGWNATSGVLVTVAAKVAAAYAGTSEAISANGNAAGTGTAGTTPASATAIKIGSNDGSNNCWNSGIKRFAFFPTTVGNTNLQTLTT